MAIGGRLTAVLLCLVAFLSLHIDGTHAIHAPSGRTTTGLTVVNKQQQPRRRQQERDGHALLEKSRGGAKETTKSSIPASVFNLVNNVAGAGILTLSAGMAAGTGWIPAMIICAILGAIGSHTFCIIGDACELTGQTDFKASLLLLLVKLFLRVLSSSSLFSPALRLGWHVSLFFLEQQQGLWAETIGKDSTYLVDSIIASMCLACAVIYSGILGDVFTPLLQSIGMDGLRRTTTIVALTVTLLLPMSLIKNLSALAFTSVLGFAAILYTVVFVTVRALDGTYSLPDGLFVAAATAAASPDANVAAAVATPAIDLPSFEGSSPYKVGFASLVLASNLGLAYIAHYNGPAFYRELDRTSSQRFSRMVRIAFTVLTLLYIVIMVAGYATFGTVCKGNILLNYNPSDALGLVGRIATGFSILFGFPLVAAGAREGIAGTVSALGFPSVPHVVLVSSILILVTAVSCTVQDVSFVVGLTGAAMGSLIVYIIPPILYMRALDQRPEAAKIRPRAKFNAALVPFGAAIGGLGVYMTVKEFMAKQ